ncbi:hypothetical protein RI129_007861 [Pyrocoelia pectoralis]|uniref:Uncharacterized protein n=1 Tax=Pyrocoelia pectoralis TaxID=417401 RepID=A0AAN7ZN71_9COLE
MVIKSTCFQLKEIYKETWVAPNGKTKNQIDHVLIECRDARHILDVRSCRGADYETDHFMVRIKYQQDIPKQYPKRQSVAKKKYYFQDDNIKQRYEELVVGMTIPGEKENNVEEMWAQIKQTIEEASKIAVKGGRVGQNKKWFDKECIQAIEGRGKARARMLQSDTLENRAQYQEEKRRTRQLIRRKRDYTKYKD